MNQVTTTKNQKTMKTTNMFKTGLMAFALIAFSACGSSSEEVTTEKGTAPQEHMHSDSTDHMHEEHAGVYQCPMKCEGDKTYAEAGQCPVCKMNLKEVK
jgi:hypothetical protein